MSQGGSNRNGTGGSGGGGITQINGDTGTTTGPIVSFTTNPGVGVTSSFSVVGTTATLNLGVVSNSLLLSRQVFTTDGIYTPTPGMQYCVVELVGGGGAGAGSDINNVDPLFVSAGSAGGGGGYANKVLSAADVGSSQVVTVGVGGVGVSGSGSGADGTESSFGILLTGTGGSGGFSLPPSYLVDISGGGPGGIGDGGDYNINGQFGSGAIGFSAVTPVGVPGSGVISFAQSDSGGSTPLGFGGETASVQNSGQTGISGSNGTGYGSGGSSAAACYNIVSLPQIGGSGANGIVIVTEYSLNASGISPLNWIVLTSNTTISPNTGYITNSSSLINLDLPVTCSLGSIFEVCGSNTGGWKISQNAGQSIVYGNQTTTVGVTGSLESDLANDCIRILCTVADTTFEVLSSQGNITVI